MENVGLETFESLPSLSKRAKSKLVWLRIELEVRHPLGKELTASRIKHWKGLSGTETRALCHYLRVNGVPIGSNNKGYFYAHSPEELESTIKHMGQRINSISEIKESLIKTQRQMKNEHSQIGLFRENHQSFHVKI